MVEPSPGGTRSSFVSPASCNDSQPPPDSPRNSVSALHDSGDFCSGDSHAINIIFPAFNLSDSRRFLCWRRGLRRVAGGVGWPEKHPPISRNLTFKSSSDYDSSSMTHIWRWLIYFRPEFSTKLLNSEIVFVQLLILVGPEINKGNKGQ